MKTPALILALAFFPLVDAGAQSNTIKATTRMRPDGSTATTVVNPETRTSEETIAEASGKVLSKTIYFLNAQNFAKGATHLDGKGKVRYKESFRFDYAGRIMESRLYSADNRPLGRRVFVYEGTNQARIEDYDAAGNLIAGGKRAGATRGGQPEVRRAQPVR